MADSTPDAKQQNQSLPAEQSQTTEPPQQAEQPAVIILPEVVAALGLQPGEITPESVRAKIEELAAKAKDSETQISGLNSQLGDAQSRIATFEQEAQTRREAELDTMLADYELDDAARGAIRGVLSPDEAAGKTLLAVMPKKQAPTPAAAPAAAAPTQEPPPPPVHSPGQPPAENAPPSEQEIAQKARARRSAHESRAETQLEQGVRTCRGEIRRQSTST